MDETLRICVLFMVIILSSVMLIAVEKSALVTYISLKSLKNVRDLKSNLDNGKMVYYNGKLNFGENSVIEDEVFGVKASCGRLVRIVEMYQVCERSRLDFGNNKEDSHVLDGFEGKHNKKFNSATHIRKWSSRYKKVDKTHIYLRKIDPKNLRHSKTKYYQPNILNDSRFLHILLKVK